MSGYMDIEEFMEVLEQNPKEWNGVSPKPNYDILLQSITNLGKLIDKGGESPRADLIGMTEQNTLTADLFSNMSDSEMLSHFIPVRGIDFEQHSTDMDDLLKKDGQEEIIKDTPSADEFLPHRMFPHLNPVYKLSSAFKVVVPSGKKPSIPEKNSSDEENKPTQKTANPVKNSYLRATKANDNDKKEEPRLIKKRKPRTYKYNPKPLQHKECRAFVPDGLKDIDYWERRKRNNEAAKKSREERRKKELEILNSYEMMKNEYSQIKIENIRLKARNNVLEEQVLELKNKLQNSSV